MKYLDVAGCGGCGVGGAGGGGVGDGVVERGESLLVFTVASSLFAALELLPELPNLLKRKQEITKVSLYQWYKTIFK